MIRKPGGGSGGGASRITSRTRSPSSAASGPARTIRPARSTARRNENGYAGGCEPGDPRAQIAPRNRVEAGQRLIEQEYAPAAERRLRDPEPLQIGAAQRAHVEIRRGHEPGEIERFAD